MNLKLVLLLLTVCVLGGLLLWNMHKTLPEDTATVAATQEQGQAPKAQLTTHTWGVFDPLSGELLAGENVTHVRPIASLTKLFTAYAVSESGKQNESITITWSDLNTEGRSGKLVFGEQTTPYDLLFPLLLESSNDAGAAIARVLGSELVESNDTLFSGLPLTDTRLVDATGLSDGDTSTVTDLARFYAHIHREHPHILDITRLRMYVGEEDGWVNNNPARAFDNFSGGKHGYTEHAGRTFIGTFHGEHAEIGIVLLGSTDIDADITAALAYIESLPALSICYNAGACTTPRGIISYSAGTNAAK